MPPLLTGLLVGLAVCQLSNVVTTVWLHRTLSHRAMAVSPLVTAACRVVTWVTTGIRPRQWVAVHRKHHAFTDVEGDPHSPVLLGYARVQLGNVGLYRRVAKDDAQVARYARDLPADRWDRLFFDHALAGLAIGIGLLCLTLGWTAGLVAAGVHMVSYLALSAAVNAAGHHFGRRSFDNQATNLRWLAMLTMGEGLHNNHHAAPTSARLSHRAGQIDPAWPLIRLLRRARLATVRHDRVVVKEARPEAPARAA